jgi:hypothetical protein
MDTRSMSVNKCSKTVSLYRPSLLGQAVYIRGHLPDIKLDSGFKEFFQYCKSQDIPVIIVSRYGKGRSALYHTIELLLILRVYLCSGMEPLIRALLANLVGDDASDIEIISNSVDVREDGSWSLKFRHPSRYSLWSFPQSATPALNFLFWQWIRA